MKATKQTATCTLQLCRNQPQTKGDKFKAAMIEAVDESLSSFNNLDKATFYRQLEDAFKIKKQEIPSKIGDFTDAIEQMFGIGAKLVEIKVIEALHKNIPEFMFFPKKTNIAFNEYLDSLRAFSLQTL